MRRFIYLFALLFLPALAYSQSESQPERKRFNLDVNVGINMSRLKSDSIDFNAGIKPFLGLNANYDISEKMNLQCIVNYSIRGSKTISPIVKVENKYLDIILAPQYEILEGLQIQVGICYSKLLESNETVLTPKGQEIEQISNYGSELNLFSGLKLPLKENTDLFVNYTIPVNTAYALNLQAGISIALINRNKTHFGNRKTSTKNAEN